MKTSSFFFLQHAAYGTVGSLDRFRTALTPVFGGILLIIRAKQSNIYYIWYIYIIRTYNVFIYSPCYGTRFIIIPYY